MGGWKPPQSRGGRETADEIIARIPQSNTLKIQSFQIPRPEDIQLATLLGTWNNFGGGYQDAGYYKDAYGIVHLVGSPQGGSIASDPSHMFVLPEGYRPAAIEVFPSLRIDNRAVVTISIDTAGNVDMSNWGALGATSGAVCLAHISFRAL